MKKSIILSALIVLLGSSVSLAQSVSIFSQPYEPYIDIWETYILAGSHVHVETSAGCTSTFDSTGGAMALDVNCGPDCDYALSSTNWTGPYSASASEGRSYGGGTVAFHLYVWGAYGGWGVATASVY